MPLNTQIQQPPALRLPLWTVADRPGYILVTVFSTICLPRLSDMPVGMEQPGMTSNGAPTSSGAAPPLVATSGAADAMDDRHLLDEEGYGQDDSNTNLIVNYLPSGESHG